MRSSFACVVRSVRGSGINLSTFFQIITARHTFWHVLKGGGGGGGGGRGVGVENLCNVIAMSTKAEPVSLRWAQGQVFSSDKRFRVLVAGRRFGKSYLSCVELLRGALNRPGETFFYCAPTYRMAKDIAWRALKKLVPKVWIKTKNETDLRIELINGSTIELKGTENAMALRGRSLSGVVLDEAAFMDSEVWFEVIDLHWRIRRVGRCLFRRQTVQLAGFMTCGVMSQTTKQNEWQRWSYTTIEGGNVSKHEVEAARAQLDSRTFRQEFEASFENLTGLVAISFSTTTFQRTPRTFRSSRCCWALTSTWIQCLASVRSRIRTRCTCLTRSC